ncbi:DUF2249 domain-containing protein [Halobaculum limi]|uniref:DUF2249 domain-containing protein n=1 Tax=Halobaculum limi TaxID=3031916 RepID=UPI002406C953|nr:DUF2249 domain-containing protein [Halobaculum sp. YSMS11]
MAPTTLDVRDLPPAQRHPQIHDAFADLDPGETLELINDHDPKPLFYELREEVDAFDADGYEVDRRGPEEFVARLPKTEQ